MDMKRNGWIFIIVVVLVIPLVARVACTGMVSDEELTTTEAESTTDSEAAEDDSCDNSADSVLNIFDFRAESASNIFNFRANQSYNIFLISCGFIKLKLQIPAPCCIFI